MDWALDLRLIVSSFPWVSFIVSGHLRDPLCPVASVIESGSGAGAVHTLDAAIVCVAVFAVGFAVGGCHCLSSSIGHAARIASIMLFSKKSISCDHSIAAIVALHPASAFSGHAAMNWASS